ERAGDGAGHRDLAGADVGFDVADDLVGQAFTAFDFLDFDRRAENGAAIHAQGGGIDDLRVRERTFQFLDASFYERLTFTGGIVFGVLGEIALGARFSDGVDHLRAIHRFQT